MRKNPKIVILGAGPCGLGAAWRLEELGYKDFKVFEKNFSPGGLSSSFLDERGFTWDIGGHILFSHYRYFDRVIQSVFKKDLLEHQREAWIFIKERWVPYPFQYNIRYLSEKDIKACLKGLEELKKKTKRPKNFKEWILKNFGKGIAKLFMLPYNSKQWAFPLDKMSYDWIGERVAIPDIKRIKENIKFKRDDKNWGPNRKFKFPLRGGIGEIWKRIYGKLNQKNFFFGEEAIKIYTRKKCIIFKRGRKENYDVLITSISLDVFVLNSDLSQKSLVKNLYHSGIYVFGIGLKSKVPEYLQEKSWIYFPEKKFVFHRVTLFSNYSPYNAPAGCWSLLVEISESRYKKIAKKNLEREIIQGLKKAKFIKKEEEIVDLWSHYEPYAYPIPSLNRNKGLKILNMLEKFDIYSRGRFGAWKYEVGNQDHSFMQGVEVVDKILFNKKELTVWHPEIVNK